MKNKQTINSNNGLFTFLTIIFGLAFCIMKLFNLGWLSIIFFPLIIGYLILFNISNILNATIIVKNKDDYLRFWLLNFFFLLSGLTFCDFGDEGPTSKILRFISDDISMCICQFSIVITVLLCIVSIFVHLKHNNDISNNQ